jgi:hypothetical protein
VLASEQEIAKLDEQTTKILIYYLHRSGLSILLEAFQNIFGHFLALSYTTAYYSEELAAALDKLAVFYYH